MNEVVILRVGHRPVRDRRVSTHAGLVARAFGADGIIFAGYEAKKVRHSLEKVKEEWGGSFFIEGGKSYREVIEDWHSSGGVVVHLTMYGLPVEEEISKVRGEDILIVIGAEKVPSEIYDLVDINLAIGDQPHSEISALAVFLDRLFEGEELDRSFFGAKKKIVPSNSGKKVEELDG